MGGSQEQSAIWREIMNKREIVNQSITNMEILFSDIGRIIKVIEEQLKNKQK